MEACSGGPEERDEVIYEFSNRSHVIPVVGYKTLSPPNKRWQWRS